MDDRRLDALGRLVENQDLRSRDQRPGDRQLLGLPAAEQPGRAGEQRGESREQVDHLVEGDRVGAARSLGDDLQVLACRQLREDRMSLGDVADAAPGALGGADAIRSSPSYEIEPDRIGSSPAIAFSNVLLPTPLRPIRQTSSPSGTSSDTSNRTLLRP